MRKPLTGIAVALIVAAALWPVQADARHGGGGGGGGGGGMRSGGAGMHSFGGGGMRSFGGSGTRSFGGVRSGGFVRSGARFATAPAFSRGFVHRGFRHHRRFFPSAAFIGVPLAYGAYSYYYDDDCYAWVQDWRYGGWRRVFVCY